MGTKWKQSRNKNPKNGEKVEQEPTKWDKNGNKVGTRTGRKKIGNKVEARTPN